MKPTEVVHLVGVIKQLAPAQRIDAYTAEMWEPMLTNIRVVDALEAVYRIKVVEPFIDPGAIVREVRALRAERVRNGPKFDPRAYPDLDEESGLAYVAAQRDHADRLADGEPPLPVPEVVTRRRPVNELIAGMLNSTGDDPQVTG